MRKELLIFSKWLTKHNYKHSFVNYGESHYFFNAPGYIYKVVSIELAADTIQEITKQEQQINKYINRYSMETINRPRYQYNYMTNQYNYTLRIRTAADRSESENYYYFRDKSIEECEKLMHEYHESGKYNSHHAELNIKLREIMDHYGSLYNKSLIKEVKTA